MASNALEDEVLTSAGPLEAARNGWDQGAGKQFVGLAVARAVAQALSLLWFVVAVRWLDDTALGEVATGLVFFAVFAGIGDMGATKTIVRQVSVHPNLLWPLFLKALGLRLAGGLGMGAIVISLVALAGSAVNLWVVALAALSATASGCTEIAFASLRTLARSGAERLVLVVERVGFLVGGIAILLMGGGALQLLGLYVISNAASAVVTAGVVRRVQRSSAAVDTRSIPAVWDAEARRTALGFALFTVTPRIAPAMLALLVAPAVVAEFAVAFRPAEGLALFALSSAVPLLPILRAHVVAGDKRAVTLRTAAVLTVVGSAVLPFVVAFIARPQLFVWLLAGTTDYGDAALTLAILGVIVMTWNLRGIGESLLYAKERAADVVRMTGLGLVVTVAVSVPLISQWASPGAAAAVLIGELTMLGFLVFIAEEFRSREVVSSARHLGLLGVVAVLFLFVFGGPVVTALVLALTVAASVAHGLGGLRSLNAFAGKDLP